ncbi:hypothetical protein A2Z00_05745 [Candidatus Gottesmanbacteria bacterium RBG_13_45_10]|uniref:Uncharacterized protein n=1 Tax=Candidatus Gottesmanbacteria bacterium RBG_13_45_10 TaxID=1798370 RepID=A0A1F5ZH58_9BACT|nr:MAG: hypothetical protein A2Z00_05745 [Candidatus Gottesmanbacteria bacterium RBG_13_45_10]
MLNEEQRNQKIIAQLRTLWEQCSHPAQPLEQQIPEGYIVDHGEDGMTRVWKDVDDQQKNPNDPLHLFALNIDGREVLWRQRGTEGTQYHQYDDDGYLIGESYRFPSTPPWGWMRTYQYKQLGDGSKRLIEAIRQDFRGMPDETVRKPATQKDPASMAEEIQLGEQVKRDADNFDTGLEDLVQEGNDLSVIFDERGNPSNPTDLFY